LEVVEFEFGGHLRRVRDDCICEVVASAFKHPNALGKRAGNHRRQRSLPVQSEREWDVATWLEYYCLADELRKEYRKEIGCRTEEEYGILIGAGDSLAHTDLVPEKA
jgi:hypothetical protein